jgi:hypothetical protein
MSPIETEYKADPSRARLVGDGRFRPKEPFGAGPLLARPTLPLLNGGRPDAQRNRREESGLEDPVHRQARDPLAIEGVVAGAPRIEERERCKADPVIEIGGGHAGHLAW